MLPTQLTMEIDETEIYQIQLVLDSIRDEAFIELAKEGPDFHDLLVLCEKHNWLHYAEFAKAVGVSESQVHRWFKPSGDEYASKRSTPNKFTIEAALKQLDHLLEEKRKMIAAQRKQVAPKPTPIKGAPASGRKTRA